MSGRSALRAAGTAVLDLLFPPRCAFCGKLVDAAPGGVCPNCTSHLPFVEDGKVLREVAGFLCAVTFYYEDPVRQGILDLKFHRQSWRAGVFGRFLAQTAAEHLSGRFDAVTYVPVSRRRNYQRGFDQARLLAAAAARAWSAPVETTLRKVRHNPAQSSLENPALRRENVRGAYAVPHPERTAGRRFLLIDDVVTTGSTLAACAQTLLDAGAASVVCAALAGGHPSGTDRD